MYWMLYLSDNRSAVIRRETYCVVASIVSLSIWKCCDFRVRERNNDESMLTTECQKCLSHSHDTPRHWRCDQYRCVGDSAVACPQLNMGQLKNQWILFGTRIKWMSLRCVELRITMWPELNTRRLPYQTKTNGTINQFDVFRWCEFYTKSICRKPNFEHYES